MQKRARAGCRALQTSDTEHNCALSTLLLSTCKKSSRHSPSTEQQICRPCDPSVSRGLARHRLRLDLATCFVQGVLAYCLLRHSMSSEAAVYGARSKTKPLTPRSASAAENVMFASRSYGLTHIDHVTTAVFPIRCWKVQASWTVLDKQRACGISWSHGAARNL